MPLEIDDFLKLVEMQALTNELESVLLAHNPALLNRVMEIYSRLVTLYSEDWLRLSEAAELDEWQRACVESLVPQGRYSIFWQDTIWNAIAEAHDVLKKHPDFQANDPANGTS